MSKVTRWTEGRLAGFSGKLDMEDVDTNGGADPERTKRTPVLRKAVHQLTDATPKTKAQRNKRNG